MESIVLYALGILFAWLLLEFLTRAGLMISSNAALMLSLGVMMIVVSVSDWLLNSPMKNARTGKNITFDDYFEISALIVIICFCAAFWIEVKKRLNRKK